MTAMKTRNWSRVGRPGSRISIKSIISIVIKPISSIINPF
jgi:hypothetical protein